MDHIKIVKRAFEITRGYRVLWLFGIVLALTTAGGGTANFQVPGGRNTFWYRPFINPQDFNFQREFHSLFPNIPVGIWQVVSVLAALAILLTCFFLVLAIVSAVVRYVSETALVRLVDGYETTGEKSGIRHGFRLGWSRAALFIFLIDLLIGVVTAVVFGILFLIALLPLLVWLSQNEVLRVIGTTASIGLGFLVAMLAILVGTVISLLIQFFRRACILENLGVFTAIRRGFLLFWHRALDVIVMALLMFAIGLGYAILMVPVMFLLFAAGAVIAGVPALLVGFVARIFLQGGVPWILAAIAGLPILMLVVLVPAVFLGGLLRTFQSSTWTLVYRQLAPAESTSLEPA